MGRNILGGRHDSLGVGAGAILLEHHGHLPFVKPRRSVTPAAFFFAFA
jgi:hypothetical protein